MGTEVEKEESHRQSNIPNDFGNVTLKFVNNDIVLGRIISVNIGEPPPNSEKLRNARGKNISLA